METNVNNESFKFKAGDRVKCVFYGDRVFTLIGYEDEIFSVGVLQLTFKEIPNPMVAEVPVFNEEGKLWASHTHPSITLVERPKRKVKKIHSGWVNVYSNEEGYAFLYPNREMAQESAGPAVIATIEVTGEYEVEE